MKTKLEDVSRTLLLSRTLSRLCRRAGSRILLGHHFANFGKQRYWIRQRRTQAGSGLRIGGPDTGSMKQGYTTILKWLDIAARYMSFYFTLFITDMQKYNKFFNKNSSDIDNYQLSQVGQRNLHFVVSRRFQGGPRGGLSFFFELFYSIKQGNDCIYNNDEFFIAFFTHKLFNFLLMNPSTFSHTNC